MDDQHQAVRSARPIGQHETAHAVHPFGLSLAGTGDLNDQVVERFAGEHPIDGVISLRQSTIIAAAMGEALPIFGDVSPERRERLNAVHRQGSLIGPSDALIWLNQNHAFARTSDYLLQLSAV
jgi:hypothetical protein